MMHYYGRNEVYSRRNPVYYGRNGVDANINPQKQWVIWKPRKTQPNQEYDFLLLLSSDIVSMFADKPIKK